MLELLFNWLLSIPQVISNFSGWLVSPLNARYLNISPLEIISVGGTTILIGLIVMHVVKLFI